MSVNRSDEINSVLHKLALAADDSQSKQIILLHGNFGVGKSWVVGNIEKELLRKNSVNALLKCETHKDIAFIPDFAVELAKSIRFYNTTLSNFEYRETEYVHLKFFENLIKIKENDFESFNRVVKRIILKSIADKTLEGFNKRPQHDIVDTVGIFDKFFDKNGDKDLMNNIGNYAAEALIVDIMNHFFRLDSRYPSFEAYLDTELPKKVLIIADDMDPVCGSAFQWLLEVFIPYCNNKSFHQFTSFDFQGGRSNIKVSDFLDFRFILSTRQDISRCPSVFNMEEYKESVCNINLEPFDSGDTARFIMGYNLPEEIDTNKAMELTSGIPLVIALWLESKSYANNNFQSFILPLVIDKIFRYSADYEIEWTKNAAFLDSIDSDSLRCFPAFESSAEKALYYYEEMNSLTVHMPDNSLIIHPLMKKYILLSTEQNSRQQYDEYCDLNNTANTQRELLLPFDNADKPLVTELAYYHSFDSEFVPEFAFGEKSSRVKTIIAEYGHFFTENGAGLSFKPEVFTQLTKYNRLADKENFNSKEEKVKNCWEEYLKFLAVRNEEIDDESTSLSAQIAKEEEEYKQKKQDYSNLQVKFMRDENELIEMRVTIADYSINKNLYSTISNFSIAVILAVAGFFITDLFAGSPNINSIEIIQSIMFGAAILFGIAGGVFMVKMLVSNSRAEFAKLNEIYTSRTKNKEERQQEMMSIRSALDNLEMKVRHTKDRISELNIQKQSNLEKMKVPFYQ